MEETHQWDGKVMWIRGKVVISHCAKPIAHREPRQSAEPRQAPDTKPYLRKKRALGAMLPSLT